MAEEKLFSEMGKDSEPYLRPENMWVAKAANRDYPAYWNDEKKKWGGLLEATVWTTEKPSIENAEIVSYREITGIKK